MSDRAPIIAQIEAPDNVGVIDFLSVGVGITAKLWPDGTLDVTVKGGPDGTVLGTLTFDGEELDPGSLWEDEDEDEDADDEDEDEDTTYRACIWTANDRQSQVVLTLPEDGGRTDTELLALGQKALRDHAGLDTASGTLTVDYWTAVSG